MTVEPAISSVAHAIQLAVAPAFLLTAIGAMLGVMTTRLARTIDRARLIEDWVKGDPMLVAEHRAEVDVLRRRARLIGVTIGLGTFAALLIASVIGVLSLGAFVSFDASEVVALLFIVAMLSLIVALLLFLREIYVATASLRIGPR
jgi:hypothetical protein